MCSSAKFLTICPQISKKEIYFKSRFVVWPKKKAFAAALAVDSSHVALYFLDREQVINLVGDDYNATTFSPTLESFWTEQKYETRPVRINEDGRVNN